ncbi:MAG: Spy/CpxP family protein refolding chaperone [Candidatus Marinimicrobia bacterium]|nr:Spy/CpxP family protein refolding chaperone [Candidatus Neomarinimicrobiota bacterium]
MKCLTTVIILLAIPALVIAGPKRVVKKHMMTGKHMEMAEKLNLNAEQKEQMHQLRVKHQKAIIPITADLKLARLELEELISSDGSSKKIDAAIGKINDLKGKFLELRVKHRIVMRNILTDDQKAMIKYHKAGCPHGPGKKGSKMGHGMMGEFFMPDWEDGGMENIEVEVIDESIAH